jgi:apolipoprotein N-acyltransferase
MARDSTHHPSQIGRFVVVFFIVVISIGLLWIAFLLPAYARGYVWAGSLLFLVLALITIYTEFSSEREEKYRSKSRKALD